MLCVNFLFWYIAHNWNYGILDTSLEQQLKLVLSGFIAVKIHFEAKKMLFGYIVKNEKFSDTNAINRNERDERQS